jgi:hypothetical protein
MGRVARAAELPAAQQTGTGTCSGEDPAFRQKLDEAPAIFP